MIRAIDHIVILVNDLQAAIDDYAALGFSVAPGGTHADGATHNALIIFADDTYLELIAFLREAPTHYWWRHVAPGEGLIDYALLPSAIADDVAAARGRGLALDGPHDGGRLRPDGVRVAWQTARPLAPGLPFLCGDVTPRELRVPGGALRQHPNGATGIAAVAVAAADLSATTADYAALLGPPAFGSTFPLGAGAITIQAAALDSIADPVRHQLERRGPGPFTLALHGSATATLPLSRTHGVAMHIIREA